MIRSFENLATTMSEAEKKRVKSNNSSLVQESRCIVKYLNENRIGLFCNLLIILLTKMCNSVVTDSSGLNRYPNRDFYASANRSVAGSIINAICLYI